ncbi:hypothetical protein [Stieleria magnilauensis]|uniref:hypothetical protein n=1 Tax=Stieleria magnilauensis TaxID=2527963 RepID=UPI003AF91C99
MGIRIQVAIDYIVVELVRRKDAIDAISSWFEHFVYSVGQTESDSPSFKFADSNVFYVCS